MELEQVIFMDIIRARQQEMERELKPHSDTRNARKPLENPIARQYGALVRRQPERVEVVRQPAKLATESGVHRLS